MERQDRTELIAKKINKLGMCKREQIVKMLLAYEIVPKQTNNGVYCMINQMNDDVIEVIYDYIIINLK